MSDVLRPPIEIVCVQVCVGHGECPFIVNAQQCLKEQKWPRESPRSSEFHLNVHLLRWLSYGVRHKKQRMRVRYGAACKAGRLTDEQRHKPRFDVTNETVKRKWRLLILNIKYSGWPVRRCVLDHSGIQMTAGIS